MSFTLDHFRFRQAKILALLAHIENSQTDRIKGSSASRRFSSLYRKLALPGVAASAVFLTIGFGPIIGLCMSAISLAFVLEVLHVQDEVKARTRPHLNQLSAMNLMLALNMTGVMERDRRTRSIALGIIESHPINGPLEESHIRTVLMSMMQTTRFDALIIGAYLDVMLRSEIERRRLEERTPRLIARILK